MRILDEQGQPLTEEQCDLTAGFLRQETIIRPEAEPIDNVAKFAWADEDYETILRYVAVPEAERRAERIAQLKHRLAETDYPNLKIVERASAAEEDAAGNALRPGWRGEDLPVGGGGRRD